MAPPQAGTFSAYGLADLAINQGRLADAASRPRGGAEGPGPVAERHRAADGHAGRGPRRPGPRRRRGPRGGRGGRRQPALERAVPRRARLPRGRAATARARELARTLGAQPRVEPQILGKLLDGEIALEAGRARDALGAFGAAQALADTWLGRFDMARVYLAAGAFIEASSELDRATARRGEATAVFLDDIPSYHLYAPVLHYRARVQEGLKAPSCCPVLPGVSGHQSERRRARAGRRCPPPSRGAAALMTWCSVLESSA